jgi:L-threonylcarbamoyladenylate synthase
MAELGKDIQKAAQFLKSEEIVAIPTETVYGLAGNAFSETAIRKIFEVKNRPLTDPLIVHVKDLESIYPLVSEFPELAKSLFKAFSPGPITILLPKSGLIPEIVTNGSALVAIRIPDHPLTQALLQKLDFPLVAPSANPFGGLSPTESIHVQNSLGKKIPYILEGGSCKVGLESTIVKVIGGHQIQILRQGGISEETLSLYCHLHQDQEEKEIVPGSMLSHYAPQKPLILISEPADLKLHTNSSFLAFHSNSPNLPLKRQRVLSPKADLNEAARNLFKFLHELDMQPCDCILAQTVPNMGLGLAINDRLKRASAKRTHP